MDTKLRNQISALGLCAWLLVGLGCRAQDDPGQQDSHRDGVWQQIIATRSDTGLRLAAFAVQDTFEVGDTIALGYVIRNSGPPRLLRFDPRFFEIVVLDDVGDALPADVAQWHGSTGPTSEVLIPHGGIVGQVFNLACGNVGFVEVVSCSHRVSILRSGEYAALVRYNPPPPPDGEPGPFQALSSDTVRFVARR